MKQQKLTFLLTVLMSVIGTSAFAHSFEVANDDGVTIYYKKTSQTTVAISCRGTYSSDYKNEYIGNVVIPESVTYDGKTYSVTAIDNYTFENCSGLTSVTIPYSVTSIGYRAFMGCSGLTIVTIPNNVTSIENATFQDCSSLNFVNIGNSVTSIGAYAFAGCSGLSSITIPKSVSSINSYAFIDCSGLTTISVESGNPKYDSRNNCNAIIETSTHYLCLGCKNTIIPNGVTTIGYNAFWGCTGLTTLTIPISITTIDPCAFYGCSNLKSLSIPSSVTAIYINAFENCTGLTTLTIPKTVTHLDSNAFPGCIGLTSITVESGNPKYDSRNGCNGIIETSTNTLISGCKTTVIPNSVTSIGCGAFRFCSTLASIEIPNSVTTIETDAFTGCTGLTSITIPNSVKSIKEGAFYNHDSSVELTSLKSVHISDIAAWCNITFGDMGANPIYCAHHIYIGDEEIKDLVIPDGVTSINDIAFAYCMGLTSVTIPNSVKTIGSSAFEECENIVSVDLGNGVTSIGDFAFNTCMSLSTMDIPNSVTFIGAGALDGTSLSFYESEGLVYAGKVAYTYKNKWSMPANTSVVLADGTLGIASELFSYCTGLTSITIPNSVVAIGDNAFSHCTGLTSITIPNSVVAIGDNAFFYCSGLTSITIPNSVKSIGKSVFTGCSGLKKVIVPDIAAWCGITFSDSSSNPLGEVNHLYSDENTEVTNLVIPNNVTSIDNFAFYKCSGLTSIAIPNSVVTIGEQAFYSCTGLTSVTIDNGMMYMGKSAFSGCSGLTSITIPNSVTIIGENSFYFCRGLTSVTIGNGVTSIGKSAFSGCSGLTSVTVNKAEPISISAYTFSNRSNATLYVPFGSKAAYEAADYWKEFKEIDEFRTPEQANILAAEDAQGYSGHQVSLNVNLTNDDEVKLCQFDLRLPAGVTVALNSKGKLDAVLTERAETHSISGKQLSNGDYRFIISSMDNDSFTGNDGALLNISLDVSATMESGDYTVKVLNVELSVPEGTDLKVVKPADTESKLTIKSYIPGDVNNDGSVSVTDVGCAINYILEQVPSVFIFDAADMNGDKSVSVTDVGLIINLILSGETSGSRGMAEMYDENITPSLSLRPTTQGFEMLLENKDNFIGIQFDVQLADGAQLDGIKLTTDSEHQMTYRKLDNGKYRVICYSPSNSTFIADASSLLTIATNSGVDISNIRLTTASFNELRIGNVSAETTGIADRLFGQNTEVKVYSLDGRLLRIISEKTGENPLQGLQPGIYMIGNRKVIVK